MRYGDGSKSGQENVTLEAFNETAILSAAMGALRDKQGDALKAALDQLPAPLYVTDADGFITYFNPACIGFAGRTPTVGKDQWCVTWRLFTDEGMFLPHANCPMADAIKDKRPIRGVTAVAERPDGTRVHFLPYPTPLLSEEGELIGAVNMLIDITEQRQLEELRSQAARCLRLAKCTMNAQVRTTLQTMAAEYEEAAALLASARSKP
jgi:PAS domain S-box-containing protein